MRATISVIIPVLNEAQRLPGLLEDLQPLRRAGHEVIVVDGGSGDGTVAVAEAGADRVLASEPGRAVQMNRGAAEAGGTVFWFLHADVRVPAGVATVLQAAVEEGHGWGRFNVRLDAPERVFRVIGWFMNVRSRLTGIATGDQGIFVTRRMFRKLGGFEIIPLMEDVELSRRLREYEWPACLRPALRVSARKWQDHGVARTVVLMWRLRLAYFLGADPGDLHRRYYGG